MANMGLESLLSKLEARQAVTSVTSQKKPDVTAGTPSLLACTPVTSVTSEKINGEKKENLGGGPRGFFLEPTGDQARLFDEAFDRVSREVQAQYVRGTCYLVRDHRPELFKETEVARKQVIRLWEQGRNGGGDLEAFKAALDEWARLRGLWAA